jgi:hypothetical protein
VARFRVLRVLVPVLSTLVLVGGGVVALSATADAKTKSLTVFVADRAPSYGDFDALAPGAQLLFDEPLLDPVTGNQVGTSKTRVEVISQVGDDLSFILDCTFEWPGGNNIVFTGAEYFSHLATGVTFAVVGGAGTDAGANGTVHLTPDSVDGQTGSTATFTFTK